MEKHINSASNPLQAIALLPIKTQVANPRRQWSAAIGLKNTMEIGKSYPAYDSCYYWPRFDGEKVRYFLCSRNRNAAGELLSFHAQSDTLEGALVMLNEKLRKFFQKGMKTNTESSLTTFEQLITDSMQTEIAA